LLVFCLHCQRSPNRQKSAAKAIARHSQRPNAKTGEMTMIEIESAAAMQGPSAGEKLVTATIATAIRALIETGHVMQIDRAAQIDHGMQTVRVRRTGHEMQIDHETASVHVIKIARDAPSDRAARTGRVM
jgi:hypothetical protein